jgi:PAS domain S-box-containing protein
LASNAGAANRKFSAELVGNIPCGTHLCQFYQNKQDLIDILVPYFSQGLQNNELCIWITSPPIDVEEAKQALTKAVPNLEEYLRKGQIEIITYKEGYLENGKFDENKVLQELARNEQKALERGFAGLRLSGNASWVERNLWKQFANYEETINADSHNHKMVALCTYYLKNCTSTDVFDVIRNHQGTLLKQGEKWSVVEDFRREQTEKALKAQEQAYHALFANMMNGFAYHKIITDPKGKPVDYVFLEVNQAFEQLTGLKRKNIIGKQVTKVLPGIEKDPTDWIGRFGQVATTGEAIKFENYDQKLGKWLVVSAFSPKKDYFVATYEDITEQKKAEKALQESEVKFRTVANFTYDWEYWIAPDGTLVYISPSCEKITGYRPEEFQKNPKLFVQIVHPEDRKRVTKHFDNINPDVSRAIEFRIVTCNKEIRWIAQVCQTIYDDEGKWLGRRVSNRDITDSKRYEQMLQEKNQRLKLFSLTATQLLANDDTQQTVESLCKNVMKFLKCNVFFNFVFDDEKQKLHLNACAGIPKKVAKEMKWLNLNEAVCGTVAQIGKRMICENIKDTTNPKTASLYSFGVKAYACHPLVSQGKVIGTLAFGSKSKKEFTSNELDVMQTVADQVAIAMMRKRQEEVIEQAKVRWERTFNTVPDMIAILDNKHRIIQTNQAMAKQLKGVPAECTKLTCFEQVHGLDKPIEACPHCLTLKDGKEHTAEIYEPHLGGYFIVSTTPLKDEKGKLVGSVHVARNITQQKQDEKKLRQLNRTLRAINDSNQALMRATDEKAFLKRGCEILVQDCGYKMVWIGFAQNDKAKTVKPVAYAGFDKSYIESLNVTWADTARGQGPTGRAIRTGQPQFCEDMKNDSTFAPWREEALKHGYAASIVLPLKNGNQTFGSIAMYSCKVEPCTKEELNLLTELASDFSYGITMLRLRKEKEQTDEFMRKQASLIDLSPDAIIVKKLSGKITFWSEGAQKLYGWTRAEAIGQRTHELLKTKFPEPQNKVLQELKRTGKWAGELLHQNKEGRSCVVESHWLATRNQKGEIVDIMETNINVTERKEMQNKLEQYAAHLEELVQERTQQLKDAERLTAIGETAGMVGHDLRNPLQTVTGETYLAKTEIKSLPDSPIKKSLEDNINNIAEQIGYMNKIVSDLQDFVKPISPDKKETDMAKLVRDTLKDVTVPADVQVQTVFMENMPTLFVDNQLLKRVFFNLFNNAVQAMPNGGKLTIKTLQKERGSEKLVVIAVEDTGEGIPELIRGKIFRPLFTTKSKGQGFGLAVCKRVIEAHGGTISFESQEGKGTQFIVELPNPSSA